MLDILRKYNFWDGKSIATGFIRQRYLAEIQKYLGNNLIKVLTGQRRVGKSYLLRQLIVNLIASGIPAHNIFYLNKEIHDFDSVKTDRDLKKILHLYKTTLKPAGKVYIFLDEVQEIENWEKIASSLAQDYVESHEVFITGSNAHLLSGELSTHISGRQITFEIYPFTYTEFCAYFNKNKSKESYLSYLKLGGLPQLYTLQGEEVKTHYVQSLKDTILLKDIVARHQIKNVQLLEQLFLFLADNLGSQFSLNAIVRYLKGQGVHLNVETVGNYIHHLLETYILHEVPRFDVKGKKFLEGNKKYYLNDLAFRQYLFSSFDKGISRYLENAIFLHFKVEGYQIYVGTIDQQEIDFILEKAGKKRYVQVCYILNEPSIIEREFGNLARIQDNYEKTVISLDDLTIGDYQGISHLQAWNLSL